MYNVRDIAIVFSVQIYEVFTRQVSIFNSSLVVKNVCVF